MLLVRISSYQDKLLAQRARDAGFMKKAEYVRSVLFMLLSIEEKIEFIYKKVKKNIHDKKLWKKMKNRFSKKK